MLHGTSPMRTRCHCCGKEVAVHLGLIRRHVPLDKTRKSHPCDGSYQIAEEVYPVQAKKKVDHSAPFHPYYYGTYGRKRKPEGCES